MHQKLGVLITCYNRKDNTLACLKNLYVSIEKNKAFDIGIDVYLVDDGSTDGTSDAIRTAYPDVRISQADGTLFWGRGMLKAWTEAAREDYDFYLWLNDDSYLNEDAIEQILTDSAKFDHKAIIAGACKATNSDTITYSGHLLKDKKRIATTGTPVLCDYFNGNVVLIPKDVFTKVGFIDGTFQHLLGDIDYGLRAKKLGIKSYITSKVIAVCDRHDALPKWCNPDYTLKERLKNFNSPLSKNPRQVYLFEMRHTSFPFAIFRASIIYIRVVFPTLWKWIGKAKI